MTFHPCPKPKPALLAKRERASDLARIDKVVSARVRARAEGRCEVRIAVTDVPWGGSVRCTRRAAPGNHHLIGGSGRKNIGRSRLAAHRLAVCRRCHEEITGHVLQPLGTVAERESAATVIYARRTS
jgi:hypothetical protein